jgi:hypothetical protein
MSLRHTLYQAYKSTHEAVTPVTTATSFSKDAVRLSVPRSFCSFRVLEVSHSGTLMLQQRLTPKEFEIAGDFLVRNYPTWSW